MDEGGLFKQWKDFLWPLGATVLALFVVLIAIEQYPEIFKNNPWILPISLLAVIVCWTAPLFLHSRAKKWGEKVWTMKRVGPPLTIVAVIAIALLVAYGGLGLLNFHKKHLTKVLAREKQPVAVTSDQNNNPNFEITYGPLVLGDGIMINHGHKTYYTEVYLQMAVLNRGADSVIKDWKAIIRLIDHQEIEGRLLLGDDKSVHTPVKTPSGRVEMPVSPSLIPKWSVTPIPRGGRGVGSAIFLFPLQDKKKYVGGTFIVKFWDVSGKEYTLEIPLHEASAQDPYGIPGMGPSS